MIYESDQIAAGQCIDADLCIIGGGPAGLSIAKTLSSKGRYVIVLESGGMKFERAAQRMSRGLTKGDPYEPLDLCRVRQYGGSTGRGGWGGWCKPLDSEDFRSFSGMPLTGWPLDHMRLQPYMLQAAHYIGLPVSHPHEKRPELFKGSTNLFAESCILAPRSHFSRCWEASFNADNKLSLVLHATALTLRTNETRSRVLSVSVAGRGGTHFTVRARKFVLACGGIENARVLLLSNGLGNQHDTVGRYFMEHPRVSWGSLGLHKDHKRIMPFDPTSRGLSLEATSEGSVRRYYGIAIRPERRARLGILGSRTWIRPQMADEGNEGGDALRYFSFWVRRGRYHPTLLRQLQKMASCPLETGRAGLLRLLRRWEIPSAYCFETILEQEPQASNRVTLDATCDRYGLQRARLEWTVGPLVHRTLQGVQKLITEEMRQWGFDCAAPAELKVPRFSWVRHHMGTTRMSDDPKTGVVDSDCRVHGTSNVFVAGSSVFPTGGNDMPTLTIMALAIKLAAHLDILLAHPPERVPPSVVL